MEGKFDFKGFGKVTGEYDWQNSSNFTSKTSDSFPTTDTNRGLEKKHDLRICCWWITNIWKISVNSSPRSSKKGRGALCQGNRTRG